MDNDSFVGQVPNRARLASQGEAGRLGIGESEVDEKKFPVMSLRAATEQFTRAAYGETLTFETA